MVKKIKTDKKEIKKCDCVQFADLFQTVSFSSFISICCSTPSRNLHLPYKHDLTIFSPFCVQTSNFVELAGIQNFSLAKLSTWLMSAESDLTNPSFL